MAAIAGILRFDHGGDAGDDALRLMARMAHRAPDGRAVAHEAAFGLAHGALHATPESVHERQPVSAGRWLLAVDGRIDNREELLRTFGIDRNDAARVGDADLFAQAWRRWGEDFWRHVVGDFAIAAWDREASRLTLMRDRIGVRPLFYAATPRFLAFASEPEALPVLDGVSSAPNEDRLAYLLEPSFKDTDAGATWLRDVRRVQPGERLSVGGDGSSMRLARYWTLQPRSSTGLGDDPGACLEAFREVFDEAVHCRLRALHRPALMLSGGIDSASVLASSWRLLAAGRSRPLLPVTAVADDWHDNEESRNILSMLHGDAGDAIRLPVPSFSGTVSVDELADAAWNAPHPVDNSILLPMLVFLAARKAGSNVVLDGIDGDLVMLTPDAYAGALALAGHPLRAWREARCASRVNTYLRGRAPASILAYGIASRLEPAWVSILRYRVQDWRAGVDGFGPLINRDFAARRHLRQRRLEDQCRDRKRRARQSRVEDLAHVWWNPGFTRAMEGFDHAASRQGVESRHPWCDQRVVEFFLGLPEHCKVRDGWTKWIARAAYAPELGEQVAWHSGKDHFGPRVTSRLVQASAGRIGPLLAQAPELLGEWMDPAEIARLQASWRDRAETGCSDPDGILLLATLAGWLGQLRIHD